MKKEDNSFVLRGAVVYSGSETELMAYEDAFVVCVNGVSEGVFTELPEVYKALPLTDAGGMLIMPGMTDLHIHAPQYALRGSYMDLELLPWLNSYVFPEEASYADLGYAKKAYEIFATEMRSGATARACVFATAHQEATLLLMEMLEESGLMTFVGKVNMDRNVPDYYAESTEQSLLATREWLEAVQNKGFKKTRPILTPRFTPSCSRELMQGLGKLAAEYDLPVQSHLSENLSEIDFVKELEPDVSCYADSYLRAGLMGKDRPCVMAHCVWSDETEAEMLKDNGAFIAHSPESNINLCSGVAPVKRYLAEGMHVGLATDVSAGTSASMFAAIRNAIYASKLRFRLYDENTAPLSFPEAFYIATKGGGAFFGKAGSFEKGYLFDALILDDASIPTARTGLSVSERAERFIYLGSEQLIRAKYVSGERVF
ncbi:MAG: amidohydrolase family protein [Lachnospiraceae bacterium]|nr:amidohydrolase family protein [Lachnospiraceae bacterium]